MKGMEINSHQLVTPENSRQSSMYKEVNALKIDWMKKRGLEIQNLRSEELRSVIKDFYRENAEVIKETLDTDGKSIDEDLHKIANTKLDHDKVAEIRKKLDLPKYVSLAETVAFIKTVIDTNDENAKEKYLEYCALGISLDDMRNVLAYENDVKPARLDTDIHHQSPNRTRSVVEIASNAIDANAERENTIGRFGVGFYQILSHIKSEDDTVSVQTGTKEDGFYEISFKLINNEIKFNLKAIENQDSNGTTVTLKSKDFPAEEAEKMIHKHLTYNASADVFCNGKLVNNLSKLNVEESKRPTIEIVISGDGYLVKDNGKGMNPQIILEKLLVPKISGKRPFDEILRENKLDTGWLFENREENDTEPGKVVINVGGVTIEEFETSQFNTVKTLVIDLPPSTFLSEERNKIAVDNTTIASIKKITTEICTSGSIESLNALYHAVEQLQRRSLSHLKEDNMLDNLRTTANENLPEDKIYIPNGQGFERLKIDNAVLINPGIKSTSWTKINEIQNVESTGDGVNLYVAPLTEKVDEPVVVYKNRIIISQEVYDKYKKDPTILNHYLEALGKSESIKIKKMQSVEEKSLNNTENIETLSYSSIEDYLAKNYKMLGFLNADSSLDFLEKFRDKEFDRICRALEKNIINNFPESYSNFFISRLLAGYNRPFSNTSSDRLDYKLILKNLDQENLAKFSKLSSDPEMVDLLLELDITPIDVYNKGHQHLKGVKNNEYVTSHGVLSYVAEYSREGYVNYNQNISYDIDFYGRKNIVFEDGKVFPADDPVYIEGTEEIFLGQVENSTQLRFVNTKTKELRIINIDITDSPYVGFEDIIKKGLKNPVYKNIDGKDLILFKEKARSIELPAISLLIDVNTGTPYNPRPDLGEVCGYGEDFTNSYHDPTKQNPWFLLYKQNYDDENYSFAYVFDNMSNKSPSAIKLSEHLNSFDTTKQVLDSYYFGFDLEVDDKYKLSLNGNILYEKDLEIAINEAKKNNYKYAREDNVFFTDRFMIGEKCFALIQEKGGETILFDDSGNIIFKLDNSKQILSITTTKEGESAYIIGNKKKSGYTERLMTNYDIYKHSKNNIRGDGNDILIDNGLLHGFQIFDFDGNEITIDDLEYPEFILIENSVGKMNYSLQEMHNTNKFSAKKGNWEYSFFSRPVKKYFYSKKQTGVAKKGINEAYAEGNANFDLVKIIDSATGKPVLPYEFSSTKFISSTQIWECVVADNEIEGDIPYETKYYIDINGEIVDVKKVAVQYHNLENKFVYDEDLLNQRDQLTYNKPIIDIEKGFSNEQQNSIKKFLSEKVFEGKIDTPSLMSRFYKYNYLSNENFDNIVEVLTSVEHLDDRLLNDEVISDVMTQLKNYDAESKVWFYKIASNIIPPGDESIVKEFTNKLMSLYKNKISHLSSEKKQEVYESFNTARDYNGEYLVNGWNIVKHKTPVPLSQIPENIRAIVDYLTIDDTEVLGTIKDPISVSDQQTFTLSELIQTKRLNETKVRNVRETKELTEIVREKTYGKSQDHIRREIIHPIYYQTVDNNYLFIRELVQNAHDAVIESTDEIKENSVNVDIYSRKDKEVTLRIEDPIGMDFHTLINYFLIPGETTKLDSEKAIGYFGQGLFTLFRGAEEVILQTSLGDGKISKLKITPQVNENGMISDLNVSFESEDGQMKGTIIERTVKTDSPVIEAAYVKNATSTFASLVDGDVIKINLNNRQINGPLDKLGSVDVEDLGTMTIYDAPNNVVTQRGLFIKSIDKDYDSGMTDVEELLKKRGYVLNIPDDIDLTRSRNEIARKEEVLEKIKGKVTNVKMRAYLEIFRQDIQKGNAIQLDNLPYDYFYFPMKFSSSKLESDVEKITKGESLDNVEDYYDRGSLISLLVRLPAIEIDDKMYSIYDLKWAALERKAPLDDEKKFSQIPKSLREKLLEGQKEYDRLESRTKAEEEKKVDDFDFKDWEKQPSFIREQISKQLEEYKGLVEKVGVLNGKVLSTFPDKRTIGTTFYYEPNSIAHATQGFGKIGWNLQYWNGWNMSKFKEEQLEDKDISHFLYVWSHEWGHILEKSREFTHNKSFYKKQAEALARLMYEKVKTI